MQNISNICQKIGFNLIPTHHFPPSFIKETTKGISSISTLLPSLSNYGYILPSNSFIEPVSPGGTSPCYSNHNEDDPPVFEREHEYSLHEMGRMFMDSLAVGDTDLPPENVNSVWLLVHGLHDKGFVDEFIGLIREALNPKFKDIRIVNYKGKQSMLLEFYEVLAAQMVFINLKTNPNFNTFLQRDWQVFSLFIKSQELSQLPSFNGVVVVNLQTGCSVDNIKGLIQAYCPGAISILVEMPVLIGKFLCTFIRTPSLEDAEIICIGLNALPTRTGKLRAALHPDCDLKHIDPTKDPFYDLKNSCRNINRHNFSTIKNPFDTSKPIHQPHHVNYQQRIPPSVHPKIYPEGPAYRKPYKESHYNRPNFERRTENNYTCGLSNRESERKFQYQHYRKERDFSEESSRMRNENFKKGRDSYPIVISEEPVRMKNESFRK